MTFTKAQEAPVLALGQGSVTFGRRIKMKYILDIYVKRQSGYCAVNGGSVGPTSEDKVV
jgi:hypothetical protein